jgi:hypothetical protein
MLIVAPAEQVDVSSAKEPRKGSEDGNDIGCDVEMDSPDFV